MIRKKLFAAVTVFIMIIGLLPDYNEKFMDSAITAGALSAYDENIVYKIADGYVTVYASNDDITAAIIPAQIEGMPVKKIAIILF